jgi:hypothetical protein
MSYIRRNNITFSWRSLVQIPNTELFNVLQVRMGMLHANTPKNKLDFSIIRLFYTFVLIIHKHSPLSKLRYNPEYFCLQPIGLEIIIHSGVKYKKDNKVACS